MSAKVPLFQGIQVTKGPLALPQTNFATLFTPTGLVAVTGIIGQVTTALGSTVTNLSLGTDSGLGFIATSGAIANLGVGSLYVPGQTLGSSPVIWSDSSSPIPLSNSGNPFTNFPATMAPFLITGKTHIVWNTNANNTGAMKWYLWYLPIDAGATVS